MAGSTDVIVKFIADTSQLDTATQQQSATFSRFGKGAAIAGAAVAAAFAVEPIVHFGIESAKAANEAYKANAKLTQVFRSMGASSDHAAKKAIDLATALSKQTAIADETIVTGMAILGTFKDVGDQAGRMSGTFERSSRLMLDMSTLFGSVDSSATQLGKALQDPATGMTALSRVGLKFTEQQKDQIIALQESGDLIGAQTVLMSALETQVGGTAAASATSMDKMMLAFSETQEELGTHLIPLLERVSPVMIQMADAVGPVLDAYTKFTDFIGGPWVTMFGPIGWIAGAFITNFAKMTDAGQAALNWFAQLPGRILGYLSRLPGILFDIGLAAIRGLADGFNAAAGAVFGFLASLPGQIIGAVSGISLFGVGASIINSLYQGLESGVGKVLDKIESIGKKIAGALNPFGSPHTVAYYVGQNMMRDLSAGAGSLRAQTERSLALVSPAAALAGPAGGGGTINITVNVPPVGDPARTGRTIVDLIRAYERQNGNQWRVSA